MRSVFFVMYTLMALWMLAAAVLRVVLSLRNGVALDALPAITGGIGLVALLLLGGRAARRVRRRAEAPAPRAFGSRRLEG
jgi:hypothetical protein